MQVVENSIVKGAVCIIEVREITVHPVPDTKFKPVPDNIACKIYKESNRQVKL